MTDSRRDARSLSVFGRGLRLGRLFGLTIVADWSLLIIFALVSIHLGAALFPTWHPGWGLVLNWAIAIGAAIAFFVSILLHEMSHAVVAKAYRMRVRGITLFVFGGVAQIEGEPPSALAEFFIAAIGPATSVAIGVAATLAGVLLAGDTLGAAGTADAAQVLAALGPAETLLLWLGPINILLGLFNMLPGFPLDGGRVLRSVLWGLLGDLRRATRYASWAGQGFGWLLIASGVLMMLGIAVPVLGRGIVQGLWLVLIGWFLNGAARVSYRQLVTREELDDLPVWRVMQPATPGVAPDARLDHVLEERMTRSDAGWVPVSHDGRFLGMLELERARQLPREQWSRTPAERIMIGSDRLPSLHPSAHTSEALDRLSSGELELLPVVDGEELRGVVRRDDILRWLTAQQAGHAQPSDA